MTGAEAVQVLRGQLRPHMVATGGDGYVQAIDAVLAALSASHRGNVMCHAEVCPEWHDGCHCLEVAEAQRDEARAEVERLRAALEHARAVVDAVPLLPSVVGLPRDKAYGRVMDWAAAFFKWQDGPRADEVRSRLAPAHPAQSVRDEYVSILREMGASEETIARVPAQPAQEER